MVDQRLVEHLKENISKGYSIDQIRQGLIKANWPENEVNQAIDLASQQDTNQNKIPTKKPTKKKFIMIVSGMITLIILIISYSTLFRNPIEKTTFTETNINLEVIDCKNSFECFIQASRNCKLSKITNTLTADIFGVKQTTSSYYEIKGLESNKCIFYIRTEKIDLSFPPEVPQETVNEQKQLYKKLEGRYGTCNFNTNDLVAMLSRWKEGNFEGGASCSLVESNWECTYTGDFEVAQNCQGDYFSQQL